jgi:hypothetical protein
LNVQLLTGRDRVGSPNRIIGHSVACIVASCRRCRRLRSFAHRCFDFDHEEQKIAAFGRSNRAIARAVPGKLSNNEHGHKKGEPHGSPFLMARFQGRTK